MRFAYSTEYVTKIEHGVENVSDALKLDDSANWCTRKCGPPGSPVLLNLWACCVSNQILEINGVITVPSTNRWQAEVDR